MMNFAQTAPLANLGATPRIRRAGADCNSRRLREKRCRSLKIDESVVFVKHLPEGFTEEDLRGLCQSYGEIESVTMLRNQETNEELHKGVVKFASLMAARSALTELNGQVVRGNVLSLSKSDVDNVKERASLKILVKQIPLECDEACVRKVFQRYGDIVSLVVLDRECEDSWLCTIEYSSFEAATAAKAGLHKKSLTPETGVISVKFTRANVQGGPSGIPSAPVVCRRRSLRIRDPSDLI